MLKKFFAGLLAVLMVATLAACGGNNAPASTPSADITMPTYPDASSVDLSAVDAQIKELAPKVKTITPGKLTLGTSADYAPYEFHILDNGQDKIVGFDIALAQTIADELGVDLEIKDIPFDTILMEINNGSADIGIAGFTPTPARLEAVDMSHLYELQSQSLLVRKADLSKYKDVADFGSGTNVGAQTGSIQEELALASTPDAAHTSLQTIPALVLDLQNQKIDAVVMETAVAEGYTKAQDDLAILCEVPYDSNGKGVVVKKGNEDLLNFVNAVVTKVVANGDMAKFIDEANAISDQAIDAAPAEDATPAAPATSDKPTLPDVTNVDMAALDAQIKELAAKVKTINPGKLTMGTSADFAPYEFHILENGQDKIVGFDVALGKAIADELGMEFEVKDISFDSILMELNNGTIDVGIAGFSPTPERMEAVDMSQLYYVGGQSLMIKKADADKIKGFGDLGAGTSVGAQTGSIQAGLAEKNTPDATLVALQTVPSIIMDLKTGKIDAAYIEQAVAENYVKTQDDLMILCPVPYDAEGGSVAAKKGNTDMINFVNAVITKVVANGDMGKFVEEANNLSDQAIG